MRDAGNILDVAALHPDYMGFIFYQGSKRFVGKDFAIPDSLSRDIKRVGVFVNQSTEEIADTATEHSLNLIQLHGDESPQQCDELKEKGFEIIKAFAVGNEFDFQTTLNYKKSVNYFLFDTKGKDFGGNGITFQWDLLKNYDQEIPFFLSGGISPLNIMNIKNLSDMNLYAIDVNSGVEKAVGVKDVGLIKKLVQI